MWLMTMVVLSACATRSRPHTEPRDEPNRGSPGDQPMRDPASASRTHNALEALETIDAATYARAGLFASEGPLAFVGDVRFLASGAPDSTLALVTLSLANRSLTFSPDGNELRGAYAVTIEARRDGDASVTTRVATRAVVRVAQAREAARRDESIVYQQWLALAPGAYALSIQVRDAGSARAGGQERRVEVPSLGGAAPAHLFATPIAVYELPSVAPRTALDATPTLIANPRAMAVFGRDSALSFYLEGYGLAPRARVEVTTRSETGALIWRDSLTLSRVLSRVATGGGALSTATLVLPLAQAGLGQGSLTVTVARGAERDSVRVPVFVMSTEEWPVLSFDELLGLLRFFTTAERLDTLRATPPDRRVAVWRAFLASTDPDPSTREHEALRAYFSRVRRANERFREETVAFAQGWLTDRGRAFVLLGEPDQIREEAESATSQRGRVQRWEYAPDAVRGIGPLRLVFIDQTGFGHWRLTPASEAELEVVTRRLQRR